MDHHRSRLAFLGVFALLAAFDTAAAGVVEDRSRHAKNLAGVADTVAAIHRAGDRSDADALVGMLVEIDSNRDIESAVRDHLLETTLLALSASTPTAQTRAEVRKFLKRRVTTFLRMSDEHGQPVVPLYDLAAAASLTLRNWETADAMHQVLGAMRAQTWRPEDLLNVPPGMTPASWQGGSIRAIGKLDAPTIRAIAAPMLQAQNTDLPVDPLLLAAAVKLRDKDLFAALLEHGRPGTARKAVQLSTEHLAAADAADILRVSAGRPELASTSILHLGALAGQQQDVRRWLFERLGNKTDGASAALALARHSDDLVLRDVRDIVLGRGPELARLRAMLILRLSRAPRAKALLRELQAETTGGAARGGPTF